jgi:hypothetical protein
MRINLCARRGWALGLAPRPPADKGKGLVADLLMPAATIHFRTAQVGNPNATPIAAPAAPRRERRSGTPRVALGRYADAAICWGGSLRVRLTSSLFSAWM